jgi:hypothetical protein
VLACVDDAGKCVVWSLFTLPLQPLVKATTIKPKTAIFLIEHSASLVYIQFNDITDTIHF